jgi:hypothetical protein
MKATAPPAKRRRGPRLAVLALVFCSLLVPIAFLFNRFPAGESSASSRYDPTPAEPPDLGECRRRRGSDRISAVPHGSIPRSFVPCVIVQRVVLAILLLRSCLLGFFGGSISDWFNRLLLCSVCDG